MPMTDFAALESLSELVALLPDSLLRPAILGEISSVMDRLEGNKKKSATSSTLQRELPELDEDDLTETFIRGSGAGGQKVNKTSNRVLLVHDPTQLRVECQDTRSLTQNRKIARKRLRMKLDDYLNGSQSKASIKAQVASSKKAKAKNRSRSRQRKKQEDSSEDSDDA
jgi:protein subunit release factor B